MAHRAGPPRRTRSMMRRVVCVVPDLFFAARIGETAKTLGVPIESVPFDHVLEACRAEPTAGVILDLHGEGDPIAIVRALKSDPATRSIEVIGFFSHVDTALRDSALEAGAD